MSVVAEGDRVLSREEIVELADAVAASSGIASGIGTTSYGAQLVVEARRPDEAVELAVGRVRAGRRAAPACRRGPITDVETIGEDDDLDECAE